MSQEARETKETQVERIEAPELSPNEEEWTLSKEEWKDPQVLSMVQACRKWSENNEVTAKTIIPFIYNLMETAYTILFDREGEERKRILLAVLLHSLDTKKDWNSEEEKRDVMMMVRKAGAVVLNFGNINIKEKVFGIIKEAKACIDECKAVCGCIPKAE